jgi:general secretion pathway protein A
LYLQFFDLNEAPFSITPDPAFVYLSAAHRDALAHLLYGVGQGGAGGFVQLTGEVGTGKTTLCRCLMEQVPEDTQLALILNPLVTPKELLATICEELSLETSGIKHSSKSMVDLLNQYLLEQHGLGRRVVVVIDEAQILSPEALEQVRLLTNLETNKDKLLQMVLLGQPELRQLLQRQNLRQLSQRITARYHLAPLGRDETFAYVRHRLKVAGASRNLFSQAALRTLYQRSAGVPRLINIIADRALVGAYANESPTVRARLVHDAANEVQPSETRVVRGIPWPWLVATGAAALMIAVTLLMTGVAPFERGRPSPGVEVGLDSAETTLKPPDNSLPTLDSIADTPWAEPETANAVGGVSGPVNGQYVPHVLPTSLDESWLHRQHDAAWQSLADLWQDGGRVEEMRFACEGGVATSYACLREHGSWARVRQLGLPVLLVLQGEESRYLLLRGMTRLGLLVGTEPIPLEVSRVAVDNRWLGEFVIPWPQAPDWPGQIQRGESGVAVEIITEMAAFADPAWLGGNVFDEKFESWVMTFQLRNGLKADGIVGPNTLLYLMAPTISEPRLIIAADQRS